MLNTHCNAGSGATAYCLSELHVLQTVFKSGELNLLHTANGIDELFFHTPADRKLCRNGDFMQRCFAATGAQKPFTGSIVAQRALTAKKPDFRAGRQPGDCTKLKTCLGTTGHLA